MKCRLKVLCSDCQKRRACPASVRRDKRARRPMADSASRELLKRAADVLEAGWYSCRQLAVALYGEPRPTKEGRMSGMVRARRPINRLYRMGVLAVRPGPDGSAEYTLLPGGREALG